MTRKCNYSITLEHLHAKTRTNRYLIEILKRKQNYFTNHVATIHIEDRKIDSSSLDCVILNHKIVIPFITF